MTTRREFLGGSAAMLAAATSAATPSIEPAKRSLSILVLGGTGFIGPYQINYALERGHKVTMFNRGNNAGLYGDRVEELVGDRDSKVGAGLSALEGSRRWDVVIDNSGYLPRHVRDSVDLLMGRVGRYIYTSTTAVYDFDKTHSVDHTTPIFSEFPDTEEITWETYGPLKAECDLIVQDRYARQATIVRPTYIVGPGDSTDRFTYWVERFHRGGDIVCPADPDIEAGWIDVRDVCHWTVRLAEQDTRGVFNAAGPVSPMSNEEMMHGLRAFSTGPVNLHWPSAELLAELEFNTPMFFWTPYNTHTDMSASIQAGLTFRSLAQSAQDTHDWWLTQSPERRAAARGWPTLEQERAVLARLAA